MSGSCLIPLRPVLEFARCNLNSAVANARKILGDVVKVTETLDRLRAIVEKDLAGLEAEAEKAGAPWTPGRVPTWSRE